MEETFGYPTTDDERNVTKDVFERYRTVKRLIRKNSATVSKNIKITVDNLTMKKIIRI